MATSKRPRRVGIRDLAARCQVSNCTVSKILNGKDGGIYPAATVERVRAAAVELGYRADLVARALVAGRTGVVGLCVADIGLPFFGEFASRFEQRMDEQGCSTFICDSREDPAIEARYVATLLARRVDALVISPVGSGIAPALRTAAAAGCTVVLFDRDLPGAGFGRVLADNRQAMAELATRCLALGHRRIGVLRGSLADSSLQDRLLGVRDALASVGLDEGALACAGDASSLAAGRQGLCDLLALPRPPTLVLSLCGALTMGALESCHRLGLVLGRDLSLAGFDDFQAAG
ncbi:MAG: LacI family DNA-binding transcriptional regulator, partial [Flavobacteriaceae bacterium]|nr:LacI family DNA-binding transcriptional regulator [Flavobacteriaceae bacterium]